MGKKLKKVFKPYALLNFNLLEDQLAMKCNKHQQFLNRKKIKDVISMGASLTKGRD